MKKIIVVKVFDKQTEELKRIEIVQNLREYITTKIDFETEEYFARAYRNDEQAQKIIEKNLKKVEKNAWQTHKSML